jgi:hypothetical protein
MESAEAKSKVCARSRNTGCSRDSGSNWLHRAYTRDELDLSGASAALRESAHWHAFMDELFRTDWVVYAKPAFGGPAAVLRYLGRYTHRVAISNHRLLAFDGERVTFRWKDYAHDGQRRTMTLTAMESRVDTCTRPVPVNSRT